MTLGNDNFFQKFVDTVFIVKNISSIKKTIKVFNYPILYNSERDLLQIPGVSEADIRIALLKGPLNLKLRAGELAVTRANIDLLQFDDEQKSYLMSVGVDDGLEMYTGATYDGYYRLRQLINLADGDGPMEGFVSGAYRETLPSGEPFPTSVIWWESSAKLKKIVDKTIVRNSSQNPIQITWRAYDADGVTVLATISDAITYSGPFETVRTRTVT